MNAALYALMGLGGLVFLYFGAEWLVKGGVAIARRCRISPLIVGLTLVAFGTSAPELFVSVDAAWNGLGDIAIGNVVGSNICNILLILGLSAVISPLSVNPLLFKRDVPLLLIASLFLAGMCGLFSGIGRIVGGVLFLGCVIYTLLGILESRKEAAEGDPEEKLLHPVISLVLVAAGLLLLVAGSKFLVGAAVFTAKTFGIPDSVVALTLVAVGTSLPELATSVVAAIKGETDIAIGNVVGSNIFNILCILGLSGMIAPMKSVGIDWVDLGLMVASAFLLWPIMKTGHRISRIEGMLLLISYCVYTAWLIFKIS